MPQYGETRTTACCEGQAALGTRIRSLNFQPVASDGLALAASTKRARGWQLGLVRTTANLYGSTAWPVNAPSMRAQASGIWRSVWTRSEEHTSELQSLMRNSYAVFCFNK